MDYLTRDQKETLTALTGKVRLLSFDQIARTWWGESVRNRRNARRALRRLENLGLLERSSVMARPELELSTPACEWNPDEVPPEFGAVSYRLKSRWREPLVCTEVYVATKKARMAFPGSASGRKPRTSEVTHDLHLAQVYLRYHTSDPERASRWFSEDALGIGPDEKRPDAVIRGVDGGIEIVIEFGGSYSKAKLQSFHRHNAHVPYQIW